jgi:ClpX C4-type zinc finger
MAKGRATTTLTCSFCGKPEEETLKLIAGPNGLAICAECVHLCVEIVASQLPGPSRIQEATLVLEDGSQHLVAAGLREVVSTLGFDDSQMIAFELVSGGRLAVRRQAVRQIRAAAEPEVEQAPRPDWTRH